MIGHSGSPERPYTHPDCDGDSGDRWTRDGFEPLKERVESPQVQWGADRGGTTDSEPVPYSAPYCTKGPTSTFQNLTARVQHKQEQRQVQHEMYCEGPKEPSGLLHGLRQHVASQN